MRDRERITLLVAGLVLLLGAGLKTARYQPADPQNQASTELVAVGSVIRHMAEHGWSVARPKSSRAGDLYDHVAFGRGGCPQPITIGLLGANVESAELFRRDYDGQAVFLQNGEIVPYPSGFQRQLAGFGDAMRGLIRQPVPHRLPLLAITPPPERDVSHCRGPSAFSWRRMDADGRQADADLREDRKK